VVSDSLRFAGRVAGEQAKGKVASGDESRLWTAERVKKADRPETAEKAD
jgi:hypothetical protein